MMVMAWRVLATIVMVAGFVMFIMEGIDWALWLNGFILGGLLIDWLRFCEKKVSRT